MFRRSLAYNWGGIIADQFIADQLALNKIGDRDMTALVWGRRVTRYFYDFNLVLWNKRDEDGHHYLIAQRESTLTTERLLLRIEAFQISNPIVAHHHRDFVYRPASILHAYSNSKLRSRFRAAENIVRLNKTKRQAPNDITNFRTHNADNPIHEPGPLPPVL